MVIKTKDNFKLTLASTKTISMVSPPAAEYWFHKRMIFTLTFHIDLNGFKSDIRFIAAISEILGKFSKMLCRDEYGDDLPRHLPI